MPADTFSTDGIGVLLMGTGNDNNTWGANQNSSVFQVLVDAITNALTNTVTGGTLDLSGSPPPAASSQVRHAGLIFNGTLSSNQTFVVPNFNKWWLVQNSTAGAFTLKFKTPSGTASTAIPQNGGWQVVACDGANNIVVWPFNTNQIQMPDGSVSAPPYSNINEPGSGWRRAGAQDWRLAINGADVLQVTGPGAASPSIVNVLSPNVLQLAGVQFIPPGAEMRYAGIFAPTGWYFEFGQAVSRSGDSNLFNAITAACTGNTHSNTSVDNLSVDLRNLGLEGAFIEGTGIPTGTTILSINSATSLTLSQAASSTVSGVSLRILPWGQGDGSTTFNLPDRRGRVVAGRDNMGGTSANRLTDQTNGVDGDKLSDVGGVETNTIAQANLPNVSFAISGITLNDPGHGHPFRLDTGGADNGEFLGGFVISDAFDANFPAFNGTPTATQGQQIGGNTTGISISSQGSAASGGSGAAVNNVQPTGISNMIIKR